MPEVDGIGVVRLLRKDRMPLIAFVTAYDAYAVKAFELYAIDYLLKPVAGSRLRETINRANDWLDRADSPSADRSADTARLTAAVETVGESQALSPLLRIPVRRRDDIVLLPVEQVVTIVADGELLHLTAAKSERHTITHRLKDLEARLPAGDFFRLSRGSLVRVTAIQKVSPMPGGTYLVTMLNGQTLAVSRIRARVLRDQILKL